uniref:tetratricopeptide repeat protein n=1 Tax=Candidatus Oscillochloris fontis TaxID=2496868 RepID=UPI001EE81140
QGSRNPAMPATQALQQVIHAFFPDAKLPDGITELTTLYRSTLAGKRVLILADDAKDAAQVQALLPPAGSALLITSRQKFTLKGMQRIDLARLGMDEAGTLLRTICLRMDDAAAQQIAAACGYLPLALRIAASLLHNDATLRSADYIARLSEQKRALMALKDPDSDANPELDVEASIALSYHLLTPQVQATLAQLGVFGASFTLAAAAAVVQPDDPERLRDNLSLLYRRSLLEYDPEQERYDLHELVRHFAVQRLGEEERAARLRYATYYIAEAKKAEQHYLAGGDQIVPALAHFERERANLDAARHWLHAHAGSCEVDTLLIDDADATAHIGDLRYTLRSERIPQLEAALAAARRLGRRDAEGRFLGNLGIAYKDLGEPRRAIAFYEQVLDLMHEIGDRRGEGQTLGNLGIAYKDLGEPRRTIAFYEQRLVIAREIGDRRGEAMASWNLGETLVGQGQVSEALGLLDLWVAYVRELGHPDAEEDAHTVAYVREHGKWPG